MSREPRETPESHVTSDPDTVRAWGVEHDLKPVRHETDGETRLEVVPVSDARADHEELSWEAFGEELDRRDQLVVRRGDERAALDVVDRADLIGHAAVESRTAADAVASGDAVETQLTERSVVERTVVEEATVESRIVDRETIESEIVDVELLTTDADHCTVARVGDPDESPEAVSRFQPGTPLSERYDVEVAIDEVWSLAKEIVERITVESRIVDVDATETRTVETDTIEETVDLEGVERTVLEGELVDSPQTVEGSAGSGHVRSEFGDDDTVRTDLIKRKTVEEEMSVRKNVGGEIAEGETVSADAVSHTVIESAIATEDEYESHLRSTAADSDRDRADASEMGRADTSETDRADGSERDRADASERVRTGASDEGRTDTAETGRTEASDAGTADTGRVAPRPEDEGKTVVNASGTEVGRVTDVDDGKMYVDSHPSITDRIRTTLGWGDHDEDTYPVDDDNVARIEDDQVVLGVDRKG